MNEKIERHLNSIIPTPKSIERGEGSCILPRNIFAEKVLFAESADTFCATAKKIFKKNFEVAEGGIVLRYDPLLPENSYTLDTRDGVILCASSKAFLQASSIS